MRRFYMFCFVITLVSGGPSLLCKALQNVLDSPSLRTKSPEAVDARAGTEYMLNWCSDENNLPAVLKFSGELLKQLNGALIYTNGKVLHQDKIWESFLYIRSKRHLTSGGQCS